MSREITEEEERIVKRYRGETEKPILNPDSKKPSPSFQEQMVDVTPIQEAFYQAFSGWVIYNKEVPVNKLGGRTKIKIVKKVKIDKYARVINESGASRCLSSVIGLINPATTTSNYSKIDLYNQWVTKLDSLSFAMLESYYFEGNPYELKVNHLADITTSIASLELITMKGEGGFTTKQITDTLITSVNTSIGNLTGNKKGGMFDGVKGMLGMKGNNS